MTTTEVQSCVNIVNSGRHAEGLLIARAREIFRFIQRFNLIAQPDIRRIAEYRSDRLHEHDIDQLPAHAIFAGEDFDHANVVDTGVNIVSRSYRGGGEYEHHHFVIPFYALSQDNEIIEAAMRATVTDYLKEVNEAEHKEEETSNAAERAQYEELKEKFGP